MVMEHLMKWRLSESLSCILRLYATIEREFFFVATVRRQLQPNNLTITMHIADNTNTALCKIVELYYDPWSLSLIPVFSLHNVVCCERKGVYCLYKILTVFLCQFRFVCDGKIGASSHQSNFCLNLIEIGNKTRTHPMEICIFSMQAALGYTEQKVHTSTFVWCGAYTQDALVFDEKHTRIHWTQNIEYGKPVFRSKFGVCYISGKQHIAEHGCFLFYSLKTHQL